MENQRTICSTPTVAEVLNTGGSNSAQAAAMFAWLQDALKMCRFFLLTDVSTNSSSFKIYFVSVCLSEADLRGRLPRSQWCFAFDADQRLFPLAMLGFDSASSRFQSLVTPQVVFRFT